MVTLNNSKIKALAFAGIILAAAIMVFGTLWTGQRAETDSKAAVHSVSMLYLDELAGRREQVVEENLRMQINDIGIAVEMMEDNDLKDLDHMRAYQRRMKRLFHLERFAFVDSDGLIYTADEGIIDEIGLYAFDFRSLKAPHISVKNMKSRDKKIVIAIPIADKAYAIGGKPLLVCFSEMDVEIMLKGVSMQSQNSGATFCNIFTSSGFSLSNTVLGGLAAEDNLLDALARAKYNKGYSFEKARRDFAEGRKGSVSFNYGGIEETLSYMPIQGTNWLLTYLIRESVISERISSLSSGIIQRSLIQSLLAALVLGAMFLFIFLQIRKTSLLAIEKEKSETENRIRHQELEEKLLLQEQLLVQKAQQEEQQKMITALSSDYRGVYFIDLTENKGICYQARKDIPGFRTGNKFPYLESVAAYCSKYVQESYREEFMRFIQPESIMQELNKKHVISFRYKIIVDGKESYESVRFARVLNQGGQEDCEVSKVGACFADVDEETRNSLMQQQTLTEALTAAEQANKAKTAFLSNMSPRYAHP